MYIGYPIFVKQIKNYVQIKTGSSQWDPHCFFLEYYCGRWLFKTVNDEYSNLVPHAFKPSVHCQECINVISKAKLTRPQIENCKYREIYEIKYEQILIPNIAVNLNQT